MRAEATGVVCADVEDTTAFGARLAAGLAAGDLLSLQGPLGAGKTSLVGGIALGLGIDAGLVRSPTFVLHHVYRGGRLTLHHLDLYRLGQGAATDLLDVDELLEAGVVVAEWGDLAVLDRWRPVRIGASIDANRGRVFTLLSSDVPRRIRELWQRPP
jgi:tRNA threonylcarbamoyladenosine biosynthesis protein TsaE